MNYGFRYLNLYKAYFVDITDHYNGALTEEYFRENLPYNHSLMNMAVSWAQNGIFPIVISINSDNTICFIGNDGNGENRFGIIMLEEANKRLAQQNITSAIPNPAEYYAALKEQEDLSLNGNQEEWVDLNIEQLDNQSFFMYNSSKNRSKRLHLDADFNIHGHFYSDDNLRTWKKSGDPKQFEHLNQYYNQCAPYFNALKSLDTKIQSLDKRRQSNPQNKAINNAYLAAVRLQTFLKIETKDFFREIDDRNYEIFKSRCEYHLSKAHSELDNHRGWKKILGNIALAIAGLGVFYAAAVLINKAATGNYLFFQKPDSSKIVDSIENALNDLAPNQKTA